MRRNKLSKVQSSHDCSDIINLQKSIKLKCKHLKIGFFNDTGRGVKCRKKLEKGDLLIALPLNLLITPTSQSDGYKFLNDENIVEPQLRLSIFLMYENHFKG